MASGQSETGMEKLTATAKGLSLPVSRKQCVEVCRMINRKTVEKARKMLDRVINLKSPVPATKFKRDIPHRKGSFGPGRFHVKAAKEVLGVINSAVSNAEVKGMKASSLVIVKAAACKGPTAWRYGRQSRRHAKRTHVEVIVEEEVKKETRKAAVKEEVKAEAKPAEADKPALPKEAPKAEEKPKAAEVKAEAKPEVKAEEKQKEAPKAEAKQEEKKETPEKKESVKKPAVKAVKEAKKPEDRKEQAPLEENK